MWLGMPDPLGSREKIKFESDDNVAFDALVTAMRAQHTGGLTVGD